MVKLKRMKGAAGGDNSVSDSVSELSHDESTVNSAVSKSSSSAFRSRFFRGGRNNNGASVSSGGNAARRATNKTTTAAPSSSSPGIMAADRSVASVGTASSTVSKSAKAESERMVKDARSRFNIGIIYLKTGDYAKAQDNLEHSLYCHIQLHGHDGREYTNDALFAIAGVRERLGECYYANPAVMDKGLALDHYLESKRLLETVAAEDAPDNIKAMLDRVEGKIRELSTSMPLKNRRGSGSQASRKYQQRGNDKAKALLGLGGAGRVATTAVDAGTTEAVLTNTHTGSFDNNKPKLRLAIDGVHGIKQGVQQGVHGIKQDIQQGIQQKINVIQDLTQGLCPFNLGPERVAFLNDIAGDLLRNLDIQDRKYRLKTYRTCFVGSEAVDYMIENHLASSRSEAVKIGRDLVTMGVFEHVLLEHDFKDDFIFYHFKDPVIQKELEVAITYLERNNHHTALKHLQTLRDGGSLKNECFRAEWVSCIMQVADSALSGAKVSLATDAYETVYSVLKEYEDTGPSLKLALRGCIKGHKLIAIESESIMDYESAIEHRTRVYKLFVDDRTVAACRQLLIIAHLHGADENYSKGAAVLADAIRRLSHGHKSLDLEVLPTERAHLLCQCHQMRAVCLSKTRKWTEASEAYDELLPLLAKTKGLDSRDYNSALIQKAALSVTLKKFQMAHNEIIKYFELNSIDISPLIVDDSDYILALDTCAATYLKIGNTDKAIQIFEKKLAFVNRLRDSDEMRDMRSDTMHKLGCLLASKNQLNAALPLLNEALDVRRYLYDEKSTSVLESTWAVAATTQTLGDTNRALREYSVLLDKMDKSDDNFPVSSVLIHNSAGKLFSEEGKVDKAIYCFRQALLAADTQEMKIEISLNLANSLSANGEEKKAMELYDRLLKGKSTKQTKLFFLALFNKSHLLIKLGEVEEAKEMLHKITETPSSLADDVRVSVYLTLGNLSVSDGKQSEALMYFENSLDVVNDGDVESLVQVKKHIGMTYFVTGQFYKAIDSLEDALKALAEREGKSTDLLKVDLWNLLSRVYRQKADLSQAKNFANLALQRCKDVLGETNPHTLRHVSNLQLLLLEEAESLHSSECKPIIDAAKVELEDALESFVALDDPWTYRIDVASLKTNLAFIALWQGKPKKARKLLRQIKEIELPPDHSLLLQISLIQERVEEMEKKRRA